MRKKVFIFAFVMLMSIIFSTTDLLKEKVKSDLVDGICVTAGATVSNSGYQNAEVPYCWRKGNVIKFATESWMRSSEFRNELSQWSRSSADWNAIQRGECGCPWCGISDPPSKPDPKYCYGNTPNIKDATYVIYGTEEEALRGIGAYMNISAYGQEARKNIHKYASVSKADCEVSDPPKAPCVPAPGISDGDDKTTTTCEGTVTKTYKDDTISCDSATMKGFYTIDCTTSITPTYDMGNDELYNQSTITLYPGQGFDYNINLKITKQCQGKFDVESWNQVYNSISDRLRGLQKDSEEWNRNNNLLNELKGVVSTFNKWNATINDSPNIKLTIDTNPSVEVSAFEKKIINDGNNDNNRKDAPGIKLADGSTVSNFTYSNEKNPRIVEYNPPEVKFDAFSGKLATNVSLKTISGGNKIYTNLDTEAGKTYHMTITIDGLADSKKITNDKCKVKVADKGDIKYRIIDVTNPFVNKDYEKGENWVNEKYDYTSVIDENTWRNNSLYNFDLDSDTISSIKRSNSNKSSAYNGGICYQKNKDEGSQYICNVVEEK